MFPPRARLSAALVLALSIGVATTACSSPADPATEPTADIADTPGTDEGGSGEDDAPAEADVEDTVAAIEAPTCDTLIGESIISDFESVGWTVKTETFYLGSTEIDDGIQCVWADYDGEASDQLQIFGWAPIEDAAAANAQRELEAQGWVREEDGEIVYITENPDTAFARDENGYGMTYQFRAGEVLLADTKQGLLLIER